RRWSFKMTSTVSVCLVVLTVLLLSSKISDRTGPEFQGAISQIKTFLHHYWLSKYPFATEKQLFKAIKDEVTALNVKDVLEELRSDAVLYRGIADAWRIVAVE
ncbi:hypothetical protein, partial [Diaphorobacter sp.]|uniref:hypothetical protein n=1 Tax=Diaphorobacter sp. TaxID=1934310 RepID=UPI003D0E9377